MKKRKLILAAVAASMLLPSALVPVTPVAAEERTESGRDSSKTSLEVNSEQALRAALNEEDLTGKVITLTDDIELNDRLEISKDCEINLAKHTLSSKAEEESENKGTLKIAKGNVTVKNGTITFESNASNKATVMVGATDTDHASDQMTATFDNCEIYTTGVTADDGPYALNTNGSLSQNATVILTDCTIGDEVGNMSGKYALYFPAGNVTMTRGTVTGAVSICGGEVSIDGTEFFAAPGIPTTGQLQTEIYDEEATAQFLHDFLAGIEGNNGTRALGDCILVIDKRSNSYNLSSLTVKNAKFNTGLTLGGQLQQSYAIKYILANGSSESDKAALDIQNNSYNNNILSARNARNMFIDSTGADISESVLTAENYELTVKSAEGQLSFINHPEYNKDVFDLHDRISVAKEDTEEGGNPIFRVTGKTKLVSNWLAYPSTSTTPGNFVALNLKSNVEGAKIQVTNPNNSTSKLLEEDGNVVFQLENFAEQNPIVKVYASTANLEDPETQPEATYEINLKDIEKAETTFDIVASTTEVLINDDSEAKTGADLCTLVSVTIVGNTIQPGGESRKTEWRAFSSTPAEQEGHYIALKFTPATGTVLTITGSTGIEKQLDEDGLLALRMDAFTDEKKPLIKVYAKGQDGKKTGNAIETYTIDLSGVKQVDAETTFNVVASTDKKLIDNDSEAKTGADLCTLDSVSINESTIKPAGGALKTKWRAFSSTPAEQEGHYIALEFTPATGTVLTITGSTDIEKQLDEDGLLALRMDAFTDEKKPLIKVYAKGQDGKKTGNAIETYTIDLGGVLPMGDEDKLLTKPVADPAPKVQVDEKVTDPKQIAALEALGDSTQLDEKSSNALKQEVMNSDKVSQETQKVNEEKIRKELNISNEIPLYIHVVPVVEITPSAIDTKDTNVPSYTVDVTPYAKVIVSTKSDPNAVVTKDDAVDKDKVNAVESSAISMGRLKGVTLTIGIPKEIVNAATGADGKKSVYIKHPKDEHSSKDELYLVPVDGTEESGYSVTINIEHFSKFTATPAKTAQITGYMIGDKFYSIKENEVNSVPKGTKITLVAPSGVKVLVNGNGKEYSNGKEIAIDNDLTLVAKTGSLTDTSYNFKATKADNPPVGGGTIKPAVKKQTMYRVYNPNSGEHFYTANKAERDRLISLGWKDEGTAWDAPKKSDTPVFRVYNPNAGDHHYTTNTEERDVLVSKGWKDEGIGWYSDDKKGVTVYRLYNKNAVAGAHHYTTNAGERDYLVSVGWSNENIGWYGVK